MSSAEAQASSVVDIARMVDTGRWSAYQKWALIIAALAVILDGFDNQILSLAIPVLVKEWGVSRDDFRYVLTAGFAGMAIGTALLGTAGDRLGRRPVLIVCVLLFSLATLAIYFVDSIAPLYVLRLLGGLGLGGAMPNATALLAELTPERRRSLGVTCGIVGIPIGGTIGGITAAALLPDWRLLFVIGGVMPLGVAALMLFALPESPKFLSRHPKRYPALRTVMRRMGHEIPKHAPIDGGAAPAAERASVGELLTVERRRDTLCLWGAMFFTLLSFYGIANWLPAVLGEAGFPPAMTSTGLTLFNLGGAVAALVGALCFGLFGSRVSLLVMAGGAILASVALALTPLSVSGSPVRLLTLITLQGAMINGVQTTLYALGAYLYATQIRGTGVGWAVGIGRLGAIVSPLVGASLLARFDSMGFFFGTAVSMTLSFLSLAAIRRHVPKL